MQQLQSKGKYSSTVLDYLIQFVDLYEETLNELRTSAKKKKINSGGLKKPQLVLALIAAPAGLHSSILEAYADLLQILRGVEDNTESFDKHNDKDKDTEDFSDLPLLEKKKIPAKKVCPQLI
jgi:hypothetical protein